MRKAMKKALRPFIVLVLLYVFMNLLTIGAFAEEQAAQIKTSDPLEYRLLFFRNDNRIWIVLPPKTTLVEIYPSEGTRKGWVKAYNRKGQVLALDKKFHGNVITSTPVKAPSLPGDRLLVTRNDQGSIGIYTPENASYIEIINSTNGFDGVINIRNKKKVVLNRQTGLDLQVIQFK